LFQIFDKALGLHNEKLFQTSDINSVAAFTMQQGVSHADLPSLVLMNRMSGLGQPGVRSGTCDKPSKHDEIDLRFLLCSSWSRVYCLAVCDEMADTVRYITKMISQNDLAEL
jgi:hypothetical protein